VGPLPGPRLTCRELVGLLGDFLEGALSESECLRVQAHIDACPDCAAYVAQLRTTIGAIGRLREEDVPAPVLDELVEAFRGWRGG